MEYLKEYWEEYGRRVTMTPSSFAMFCLPYLNKGNQILDICCGNGRDSLFFNTNGVGVYSFDIHPIGINGFDFKQFDLVDKKSMFGYVSSYFDVVYCRFVLHAVPEYLEDYILINTYKVLSNNGLFCIEVRSDKGKVPETDHYRRLINLDVLRTKLNNLGFEIIYHKEGKDLSIYENENPVLIRIIAKKTGNIKLINKIEYPNTLLNQEWSGHLLLTTKNIFDNNGITFLLGFGTLLGVYRDKKFIEHDTDVDILLYRKDLDKVCQLISDGYFALHGIQVQRLHVPYTISLLYKQDYIDFFFYEKGTEEYTCDRSHIHISQLDNRLSTISFLGKEWLTVHDIKAYLIRRYGINWSKPKKGRHARY